MTKKHTIMMLILTVLTFGTSIISAEVIKGLPYGLDIREDGRLNEISVESQKIFVNGGLLAVFYTDTNAPDAKVTIKQKRPIPNVTTRQSIGNAGNLVIEKKGYLYGDTECTDGLVKFTETIEASKTGKINIKIEFEYLKDMLWSREPRYCIWIPLAVCKDEGIVADGVTNAFAISQSPGQIKIDGQAIKITTLEGLVEINCGEGTNIHLSGMDDLIQGLITYRHNFPTLALPVKDSSGKVVGSNSAAEIGKGSKGTISFSIVLPITLNKK